MPCQRLARADSLPLAVRHSGHGVVSHLEHGEIYATAIIRPMYSEILCL